MREFSAWNWVIVVAYLGYIVWYGLSKARGTTAIEAYYLANRSLPWWAVGLSVMATQLSAITMIGTTGQGATDGLRFIQFYFGLPVAMVILGVTLVPFLRGEKVYTAYEYLERRFDAKTRSLTAFLFLISRAMSCGAIISAPAVVFSAVFGWPILWCVALIGIPTIIYTMIGGVQAIAWVDVKQMFLIVGALLAVVVTLLVQIPVSPNAALHIAGAAGRLRTFDFSLSLTNTYTFWSGVIGGTFLMLSYFGTDQSQVQRYLAARSVEEARTSLLVSAYWKIPLQALVLMVGVLVFVFFQFQRPPLLFNPAHERAVREGKPAQYSSLEKRYQIELAGRDSAARALAATPADSAAVSAFRIHSARGDSIRVSALDLAHEVTGEASKDVNYIMPRFAITYLPFGLSALFIAAVIAAAMNAIAAELASLSTASVIDFYRRWWKPEGTDDHFLKVGRTATGVWGIFAMGVAVKSVSLGSLIETVNRYGSIFYGSILGVFLLSMMKRAKPIGAFVGLIAGMSAVGLVIWFAPDVSYLWHNVIGAVTVVVVGLILSL